MRALCLVAALTTTAAAQEYPVHGLLGATALFEGSPPAAAAHDVPEDGLARCATALIDQKPDGSFVTYVIDRAAFSSGELAFYPVVEGKCTLEADGFETCITARQAPSLTDALEFHDVTANPSPEGLDIAIYDTQEDALARTNSPGFFKLYQCPVDANVVRAALKAELSSLSEGEINALRFPSEELLSDATTAAIMETIRQ